MAVKYDNHDMNTLGVFSYPGSIDVGDAYRASKDCERPATPLPALALPCPTPTLPARTHTIPLLRLSLPNPVATHDSTNSKFGTKLGSLGLLAQRGLTSPHYHRLSLDPHPPAPPCVQRCPRGTTASSCGRAWATGRG
jgi:hypothetical protein